MKNFKNSKDIKVGVIGYGGAFNMGKGHLNEMKQAGMTPYAVVELDESRLKVAKEDFPGIETYSSVTDMLKKSDCNLITIITPHNSHAAIATQCLKAGKSVVCEKPLAITTKECDAMIAAAKKSKSMISTYHNRHWDGCVLQAVKMINKQKVIGDILRIEITSGGYGKPGDWWRSSKSISGGILYDWGVHFLEYALQLMPGNMTEVSGYAHNGFWGPQTAWGKDGNEDEATAVVRFDTGSFLSLRISNMERKGSQGFMKITGTKGTYVMDHTTYELTQIENGKTLTTSGKNIDGQWPKFYKNIANHLVKNEKLVISAEWARRPIHILDLADQSAKKGKSLPTKYK